MVIKMYRRRVIITHELENQKDKWKDEYKQIKRYIESRGYKANLYNDYKHFFTVNVFITEEQKKHPEKIDNLIESIKTKFPNFDSYDIRKRDPNFRFKHNAVEIIKLVFLK